MVSLFKIFDNTINAMAIARITILHSSVMKPLDLINSIQPKTHFLQTNLLLLLIHYATVTKYIEIIHLKILNLDSKLLLFSK